MDSTDLAARMRRLEDRHELRDLTIKYTTAMDDSDWPVLRELFTDDAEVAGVVGGDEAIALLRSIRSTYGRTIHTAHGQLVEFSDDDHATGMVPSRAELDIKGQTVVCSMRYYDTYVRDRGSWRFRRRDIKFVYALPWDQMSNALIDERPVQWPGTDPTPADVF
jgi:hypothetical protein